MTDATTAGGATASKSRLGYRGYAALGAVSALVALVLVPPVFGAVAVVSGVQVFRRHSELVGLVLAASGGVAMVLGLILAAAL